MSQSEHTSDIDNRKTGSVDPSQANENVIKDTEGWMTLKIYNRSYKMLLPDEEEHGDMGKVTDAEFESVNHSGQVTPKVPVLSRTSIPLGELKDVDEEANDTLAFGRPPSDFDDRLSNVGLKTSESDTNDKLLWERQGKDCRNRALSNKRRLSWAPVREVALYKPNASRSYPVMYGSTTAFSEGRSMRQLRGNIIPSSKIVRSSKLHRSRTQNESPRLGKPVNLGDVTKFRKSLEKESEVQIRDSPMNILRFRLAEGKRLRQVDEPSETGIIELENQVSQTNFFPEIRASDPVKTIAEITAELLKFVPKKIWIAPPIPKPKRRPRQSWRSVMSFNTSTAQSEQSTVDMFDSVVENEIPKKSVVHRPRKMYNKPYRLQRFKDSPMTSISTPSTVIRYLNHPDSYANDYEGGRGGTALNAVLVDVSPYI